ncbi:MAG: hypothetical protein WC538_23165 [Thermoanaerobaculia bacterium]
MRVASYEWRDPAAMEAPLPVAPGATLLPGPTDLMRRARVVLRGRAPDDRRRLALFESDAALDEVAKYYAAALGGGSGAPATVVRSAGDFARDEATLAPLLGKLGQPFTPGAKGPYLGVEITAPGRPRVSLQRPYRDFVADRIVDRTLIVVSD